VGVCAMYFDLEVECKNKLQNFVNLTLVLN
jgi:hypothetical protein